MCEHEEHRRVDRTQLYGEALVVGASIIPVWAAVTQVTTIARINFESKPLIDVFLSGFLYHLLAEELGVNTWYLTNSHAANNVLASHVDDSVLRFDLGWFDAVSRASGLGTPDGRQRQY